LGGNVKNGYGKAVKIVSIIVGILTIVGIIGGAFLTYGQDKTEMIAKNKEQDRRIERCEQLIVSVQSKQDQLYEMLRIQTIKDSLLYPDLMKKIRKIVEEADSIARDSL